MPPHLLPPRLAASPVSNGAGRIIYLDRFVPMSLVVRAASDISDRHGESMPAVRKRNFLRGPVTLPNVPFLFDHNPATLRSTPVHRIKSTSKTARAFHLKLVFRDFYVQPRKFAERYLEKWYRRAIRSRIPAMVDAARAIPRHWGGVLPWFISRISNGLLERLSSLVQLVKAKARGYASFNNLRRISTSSLVSSIFNLPT